MSHHQGPIIIADVRCEGSDPNDHCLCKVPVVSTECAIIVLIINILLPGWGTMLLGCISDHNCGYFFVIGLIQFFLTVLLIGWIWSIITGIKCLRKSR